MHIAGEDEALPVPTRPQQSSPGQAKEESSNDDNERMVAFAAKATVEPLADSNDAPDPQVASIVEWVAKSTPHEVMAFREKATLSIERLAEMYRRSGEATAWLESTEKAVRGVVEPVSGPLLAALAKATAYSDPEVVEMLRRGAPLLGKIPASPDCKPGEYSEARDPELLRRECQARNKELLGSLKRDKHADYLEAQAKEDATKGRMSDLVPVSSLDREQVLLGRRFAREQGVKTDGSPKIRAIDDETGNGTNECARQEAKLQMDGLDALVTAIQLYVTISGRVPGLWKGDVDAAFRRVPIQPQDRWAAWVAFLTKDGTAVAAQHYAQMFGAIAAVHGWDRVGALVKHVLRVALRLPVFRYVDDYYSIEHKESAVHALGCFARVVRAMLGKESLSPAKMATGAPLDILGITVGVTLDGIRLELTEEKRLAWAEKLRNAKQTGVMMSGEASKFAGRLNFTAQKCFHKLGRAMVRPFYAQQYAPLAHGRIGGMLTLAVDWWLHVLQRRVVQSVPMRKCAQTVELFCDARGEPARMAAVLFVDGEIHYTSQAPSKRLAATLMARKDKQIMAWELLAIALGISTFKEKLAGRMVRIWCDNAGGENVLRTGSARSVDHNLTVHGVWLHAARTGYGIWVERVPTKDNIADLPSRESYGLLQAMGARWVEPVMDDAFLEPTKWEHAALVNSGPRLSGCMNIYEYAYTCIYMNICISLI